MELKRSSRLLWASLLTVVSFLGAHADRVNAVEPSSVRVYLGTYTNGQSKGIYLAHFNPATGTFDEPKLAAEVSSPSFLAIHPNGRWLYCVMEGSQPGVSSFTIDAESGMLKALNHQPSGGGGPCHLTVETHGRNVLVANYGTGHVAVLPVAEDGSLKAASCVVSHEGTSVDRDRQDGPHAHEICFDPSGRFAFEPDLGLDKVFSYKFDPNAGKLIANDPAFVAIAPGSGPRHIAFDADAHFAYVVSEMASTVTTLSYDAEHGSMRVLQTLSMLPKGFEGRRWAAEVAIAPGGQFLYASNRGHGSIASYQRDPATGLLRYLTDTPTGGEQPRHFAIDSSGRFLIAANQDANNLVTFRIGEDGSLSPVGKPLAAPAPCCVLFASPAK